MALQGRTSRLPLARRPQPRRGQHAPAPAPHLDRPGRCRRVRSGSAWSSSSPSSAGPDALNSPLPGSAGADRAPSTMRSRWPPAVARREHERRARPAGARPPVLAPDPQRRHSLALGRCRTSPAHASLASAPAAHAESRGAAAPAPVPAGGAAGRARRRPPRRPAASDAGRGADREEPVRPRARPRRPATAHGGAPSHGERHRAARRLPPRTPRPPAPKAERAGRCQGAPRTKAPPPRCPLQRRPRQRQQRSRPAPSPAARQGSGRRRGVQARATTRLGRDGGELASLYLIAGTDEAKIDATRARLRARAEGDGGAGALEVFEPSEGRGGTRPRGAAGRDPGDVADRDAPLPARRRGRALARPPARGGRRARSERCRPT